MTGTGTPPVFVVCSLFRPGRYLDEQLETILAQTHASLRVLVRDDGCDEKTARAMDDWMRRDDRIEVMENLGERIGTASSQGRLIEAALARGAEWIALADQDDEWRPDHLSCSLEAAARLPRSASQGPMLVHGDLELIDEEGRSIAPSFFAHQRIRHEKRNPLRVLLVQNFVTGCATLINRPLAELAVPIPSHAIMHDWWLASCAASAGRVIDRGEITIRYRQHDRNQIGARPYADVVRDLGRRTLSPSRHSNESLLETVSQVQALRQRLRERARESPPQEVAERMDRALSFIDRYLALYRPGVSRLRRSFGMWRLGVGRQDPLLDLSLKSKLLTTRLEVAERAEDESSAVLESGQD